MAASVFRSVPSLRTWRASPGATRYGTFVSQTTDIIGTLSSFVYTDPTSPTGVSGRH